MAPTVSKLPIPLISGKFEHEYFSENGRWLLAPAVLSWVKPLLG